MTGGGSPFGGRAATSGPEEPLAAKNRIAEKLFGNWTKGEREDASAIRLLTYSPGQNDMLTAQDSKNVDIYTTTRWAAKRAHEMFRTFVDNRYLFDPLALPTPPAPDMDEIESDGAIKTDAFHKFDIVIVGSSVAGLVFHGTLLYLFEAWQKQTGAPYGLSDYFSIRFLDSHKRPLQRLRQARDRRIVPRFEYERLLDVDRARTSLKLHNRPGKKRAHRGRRVAQTEREIYFVERWNDVDTLADPTGIQANLDALPVQYVPMEFCWEAGTVRHVADQILEGYKSLTQNDRQSRTFDSIGEETHSTTGGHLYRTAQSRENGFGSKRVGLWTVLNRNPNVPTLRCDFVLLATGPVVDVSPTSKNRPDQTLRFHANSQASYWNTPKIELDVVESDKNNVLILGHSDSAAGSVYSNLFNDPDACSYRFLTELLGKSQSHRTWFRKLKQAVARHRKAKGNEGLSITAYWQKALKDKCVQAQLFAFPEQPNTAASDRKANLHESEIKDLLRSYVTVSLAYRTKKKDAEKKEPGFKINYPGRRGEPPIFLDCVDAGHDWPKSVLLRDRLFADAWPENRIIMALLSPHIRVFQENGLKQRNLITRKPVAKGKRAGSAFRYSVPLYTVKIPYRMDGRTELTMTDKTFKYVLDCRGDLFGTKYGNFHCFVA